MKWEPSLGLWVDVLRREGKYAQVEEMLNGILTPTFSAQPQSAGLLRLRADFFARRGQWKQAAADTAKVLEFEPNAHYNHAALASLLVASDDLEGYRQLCQRILARFGGTNIPAGPDQAGHPEIYERMAKACLILPSAGVDLESVAQLAETAVEAAKNHPYLPFFQFCKGLAEYRLARFATAVNWTQLALLTGRDSWSSFAQVQACMVLAMAHRQLGHTNEARTAFDQGIEIERAKSPKLESGDIGEDSGDWMIAHKLMDEAKALIESQPASAVRQR